MCKTDGPIFVLSCCFVLFAGQRLAPETTFAKRRPKDPGSLQAARHWELAKRKKHSLAAVISWRPELTARRQSWAQTQPNVAAVRPPIGLWGSKDTGPTSQEQTGNVRKDRIVPCRVDGELVRGDGWERASDLADRIDRMFGTRNWIDMEAGPGRVARSCSCSCSDGMVEMMVAANSTRQRGLTKREWKMSN